MTYKTGILNWDIDKIANSLKISKEDVQQYFTDGRRVSFLLERRLAKEILKGKLADSEGKDYDVIDNDGKKYEVRSISKDGIYFCPSYMVGSSRSFNEIGFIKKAENIEGYILCDITLFPNIKFYIVSAKEVIDWYKKGLLGKTTKITKSKALKLLSN